MEIFGDVRSRLARTTHPQLVVLAVTILLGLSSRFADSKAAHRRRPTITALFLTLCVLTGLSACGGNGSPPPRYSSTYPPDFSTSFAHSCGQAGASVSMCSCGLARIESAANYPTLAATTPAIIEGAEGATPAWWSQMQTACARHGGAAPRYVAPRALGFLLPQESGSPYPPAVRQTFLHACKLTSREAGSEQPSLCECVIGRIEAQVSLSRFAEDEAELARGDTRFSAIFGPETGYCLRKAIHKSYEQIP